jgi:hypothetical protein
LLSLELGQEGEGGVGLDESELLRPAGIVEESMTEEGTQANNRKIAY